MRPVRSHVFRGRRWRIHYGKCPDLPKAHGVCEAPWIPDKGIWIPEGDTLHALETTLHEAGHACHWDLDEEAVQEAAHDTASLLRRLGWVRREG
jgi:hypothetical protein